MLLRVRWNPVLDVTEAESTAMNDSNLWSNKTHERRQMPSITQRWSGETSKTKSNISNLTKQTVDVCCSEPVVINIRRVDLQPSVSCLSTTGLTPSKRMKQSLHQSLYFTSRLIVYKISSLERTSMIITLKNHTDTMTLRSSVQELLLLQPQTETNLYQISRFFTGLDQIGRSQQVDSVS